MKLIHCADMHLDSKMRANLDSDRAKERKLEILNTFLNMIEYAASHNVEGILIAGDLFDSKNISALSRNSIIDAISKHPDIGFYYIRGNHDANVFLNAVSEIPDNLFLFDNEWSAYSLGDSDRVILYGAELLGENSMKLQNELSPDPSKINIVMLHGQDSEAVINVKDKTEVVNIRAFKNKSINYLALGHIHEYKMGRLDSEGVYAFSGCLEGRGFDELGDKGFILLDIDEEKKTVTPSFIPFAKRRLYQVDVDITGKLSSPEIISEVNVALSKAPAKDIDLVKIVLKGSVDIECEKDLPFILSRFEDNYYFTKIYDETTYKVDTQKFIYDESLKGEFVRTIMNDASLSDEEKGEIIKMGLHVINGGGLLE